nr:MAG TPA: hypothetical protein [Caudoviricetes sp.]
MFFEKFLNFGIFFKYEKLILNLCRISIGFCKKLLEHCLVGALRCRLG